MTKVDFSSVPDSGLLAHFAADRDQCAFNELVMRHGLMVMRTARRILSHEQDAEDAFQSTFLALARAASRREWTVCIAPWLCETAKRCAREILRTNGRWRRKIELTRDSSIDSYAALSTDDITEILIDEIRLLPTTWREAVVVCDVRQWSRNEAASRLRVPTPTVKTRLARGRKRLAQRLVRRGLTESVEDLATAMSSRSIEFLARAFSTVARAEAILVDNFRNRNDDDWSLIVSPLSVPGIADASSSAYHLGTVHTLTGPKGVSSRWRPSLHPEFAHGYWRATVRADNSESDLLLSVRGNSSSEATKGYVFAAQQTLAGPRLAIHRLDSASHLLLELAETPIVLERGAWQLEAGAVGDQLTFKAWHDGDAEPATPQLAVTDDTLTSGGFGLAVGVGPGRRARPGAVFEDVHFIPSDR